MKGSIVLPLTWLLLSVISPPARALEPDFEDVLRFEATREGETVPGWGGGPPETLHLDRTVVHAGDAAARVERDAASSGTFSSLTQQLPVTFQGQWLELRGYLRSEGVEGQAGFWLRQDGASGPVHFETMLKGEGAVRGTTEWAEYTVKVPFDREAQKLNFGIILAGIGKVWADDLVLRIDGKPVADAPERVFEKTVLDTDKAFDTGSGIKLTKLTDIQVRNLSVLGRVWGFLKYHHPKVAAGALHWDYELFRVLPKILAATDRAAGIRVLEQWVEGIGVPSSCWPCASEASDVHLPARLDWLDDIELLGQVLSNHLKTIHRHRYAGEAPFYIGLAEYVGNPIFKHELPYSAQQPPDPGYRILALLRYWNIIEHWFPYRDQLDDDWPTLLPELLPKMVAAEDWDRYRLELLKLIARVDDTHANLWAAFDLRPPRGDCRWPVETRFIEGKPTVTSFIDTETGPASGLEIGDVVETIDGQSIGRLIAAWSPYYAASNDTTRLRDIARFLSRGPCGKAKVGVARRGEAKTLDVERLNVGQAIAIPRDRPGETFQKLSAEVAYLKLSSVRISDVDQYIERAAGSQGLVIDIRNYPSEFVVFYLGTRLVGEPTAFVRFTRGDLDNPGAFTWSEPLVLSPTTPGYRGKIAVLVDEVSLSQAEYTAMAFSAGPNAVVVGSTTAGADGNVSSIVLPGGLQTMISGIGIFYPDKTPTQRVGIVPDIVATTTTEGIRAGRDEILEAALRHLLGPDTAEEEIRRLARRP